jgi:hypothetical protein
MQLRNKVGIENQLMDAGKQCYRIIENWGPIACCGLDSPQCSAVLRATDLVFRLNIQLCPCDGRFDLVFGLA